jgi:uncharacterized membrane protein YozB (DUF420 family)
VNNLFDSPGFLGTKAPFHADVTLMLILATAGLFTIGWRLAVRKRYKAHRRVQTSTVVLNTLIVLWAMIGSFIIHILPGIPGKLNEGDYAVTTVHALTGMLGLVLGLFIVLRGNKLVPKTLQFKNYKLFMRTSYVLYLFDTLMGGIVYCLVYIYGI